MPINKVLYVETNPAPHDHLPEEYYRHDQIIGLSVRTTDGKTIGTITEILTGKSNDNYIVQSPTGEILIPAIEDVIESIDLEGGFIIIEAIDGLLDLNENSRR